jgi:hypothetical protein
MKRVIHYVALGSALAAGLVLASSQASAMEPDNNTIPAGVYFGNPELYQWNAEATGEWAGQTPITAGDVDYVVVSCSGLRPVARLGIRIYPFYNGPDLDIQIYDMNGTFLGSSTGTGALENFPTTAFGKQALIMKVYGFAGATGTYDVMAWCQTGNP